MSSSEIGRQSSRQELQVQIPVYQLLEGLAMGVWDEETHT